MQETSDQAHLTRIADEHGRLMQAIAEHDNAPAALRDTIDLLEGLEKDLKVREVRMKDLVKKRKAEAKDVDKLQRSGTKRFFFKMRHGGKEGLDRKLEKEEREYIEAAQAEYNENQAISELKEAAENARAQKIELESQVAKRKEMLQRITELYSSAFSGPTPDFPEEDAAEDGVKAAELHYEEVQSRLNHEKNVFSILDRAAACANEALRALQNANRSATYDTIGIGGIWSEMAERDDLLRAQTLAAQAQRHLQRARQVQPLVNVVPGGEVVKPEWLNVVFDNLYTDFLFQQKIQQSISSISRFQQGIFAECRTGEERVKVIERDAQDASEFLKARRRELSAVRRDILTRVREEGAPPEVPPLYMRQPEPSAPVLPSYDAPSSQAHILPIAAQVTRSLSQSAYQPPAGPPPNASNVSMPPSYSPVSAGPLQMPQVPTSLSASSRSPSRSEPHSRNQSPVRQLSPRPSVTGRYAPPPGPPPSHLQAPSSPGARSLPAGSPTHSAPASPGSSYFSPNPLLSPPSPRHLASPSSPPRSRSPSPSRGPFSPSEFVGDIKGGLNAPPIPSDSSGAGPSSARMHAPFSLFGAPEAGPSSPHVHAPFSPFGVPMPAGFVGDTGGVSSGSPPSMPMPMPFNHPPSPSTSATPLAGTSDAGLSHATQALASTSISEPRPSANTNGEDDLTGVSTRAPEESVRRPFASKNPFRLAIESGSLPGGTTL